jgi:hypothetical protein
MVTRRRVLGWTAAFTAGAGMTSRFAGSAAAAPADGALASRYSSRGKIFYKGDAQYEPFRVASTWNARKPDRFPEAIVLPQSDTDVIAAVKLAKERGWQIGTRSGGHSWNAPHTRDGALLINLARMKELTVDPAARVAVVSPSWRGEAFNKVLREQHQLIFPAAHCVGVGLGGFVLSGGPWLESPGIRAWLRESPRAGRGHGRRRADSRRREPQQRLSVGRAWRGARIFRRCRALLSAAAPVSDAHAIHRLRLSA